MVCLVIEVTLFILRESKKERLRAREARQLRPVDAHFRRRLQKQDYAAKDAKPEAAAEAPTTAKPEVMPSSVQPTARRRL